MSSFLLVMLACGGTEPAPSSDRSTSSDREMVRPEPVPDRAPVVVFASPTNEGRTPAPITKGQPALAKDLARVRGVLEKVVMDRGRDPNNPWAVSHAMLALGPDIELTNGESAVDYLFATYAEVTQVDGVPLLRFPPSRGPIRIEPHTDLILKALTEGGLTPDYSVTVKGKPFSLGSLYRHSLWRTWVTNNRTGFQGGSFNDAPWALQALAAWGSPGLAWRAKGGRDMSLSAITHRLVQVLQRETAEMSAAMEAGIALKKDTRRGLFRYTCGGQHFLQGIAFSVARWLRHPRR